jgi:hypothetical protein
VVGQVVVGAVAVVEAVVTVASDVIAVNATYQSSTSA